MRCRSSCNTCRAQALYDSRKNEMDEELARMTVRNGELQAVAQEKATLQGLIDTCRTGLQVRAVRRSTANTAARACAAHDATQCQHAGASCAPQQSSTCWAAKHTTYSANVQVLLCGCSASCLPSVPSIMQPAHSNCQCLYTLACSIVPAVVKLATSSAAVACPPASACCNAVRRRCTALLLLIARALTRWHSRSQS